MAIGDAGVVCAPPRYNIIISVDDDLFDFFFYLSSVILHARFVYNTIVHIIAIAYKTSRRICARNMSLSHGRDFVTLDFYDHFFMFFMFFFFLRISGFNF